MGTDFLLVYVTFPTKELATELCNELVTKKLAACANIFGGHTAIYEWNGKLESNQEFGAFIKTKKELFESLKEELIKKHPYECPCVIAIEISSGNLQFLEWIKSQTN
jgi:periplasmic divalent cation tolerance protein